MMEDSITSSGLRSRMRDDVASPKSMTPSISLHDHHTAAPRGPYLALEDTPWVGKSGPIKDALKSVAVENWTRLDNSVALGSKLLG